MTGKNQHIEIQRLLSLVEAACDSSTLPFGRAVSDARDVLIDERNTQDALNTVLSSDKGREALSLIVRHGIQKFLLDVAIRIDDGRTPVRVAIKSNGNYDLLDGYDLYEHLMGFFMDP